ncbi:porin family protein [Mucilaginibacter sp. OK098]|uniref:porin family protein n=1 Tax=Mucilaginibacter sp. OK098 TaxID=1855297 RepID=UPI00091BD5EA|nr:porin family protein [Mucilaginibacter sp. OK098]SHM07301.1 Outer membrane protein beta-barrel domain-containing protein [Mucilaginibacter sp. OK098]
MKKLILTLAIATAAFSFTSAQILPSFQFGIKGGVNLSKLNYSGSTFNSSNRAGYLGGLWARVGALGFNFQPELYLTAKNVEISDNGTSVKAKFTSLDVPLLFGGKVGAFGFGGRFYTGPLVSFAINKDNSLGNAFGNATSFNYKDQNFAWVFGAGVDIKNISIDLRYEAGLTKQTFGDSHTRVSLFNLSLAVPLIKI